MTFIKEGIRYQYGFIVDENRIYEEWLYAYPSNRSQQWFNRYYDSKNDKYQWKFSKFFKGSKQVVDFTRSDVLFLSNAVKLNNEQLEPVFTWFQKDLVFIDPSKGMGLNLTKSIDQISTPKGKQKILKFMNSADSSISDIIVETEKFSESKFPLHMPEVIKDYLKKELTGKDVHKINFIHSSGNVSLELEDESDGTQRLLGFAGPWIDALANGRVLSRRRIRQ